MNGTGLLFSRMKGNQRDPEANLELAIFLSHLRIAVLSRTPLSEKTLSIVAIVGVGRI